jgi:hypothetical protein
MKYGMKHGLYKSVEYRAYHAMKDRCLYPLDKRYPEYGGRGITVCERWLGENGFLNFLADVGPRPGPEYSLDRYPNNATGNYEPGNVRWATIDQQANNTRTNKLFTLNGVTLTQAQWTKRLGLSNTAIASRLEAGWSLEDALTKPSQKRPDRMTHCKNGHEYTATSMSMALGYRDCLICRNSRRRLRRSAGKL